MANFITSQAIRKYSQAGFRASGPSGTSTFELCLPASLAQVRMLHWHAHVVYRHPRHGASFPSCASMDNKKTIFIRATLPRRREGEGDHRRWRASFISFCAACARMPLSPGLSAIMPHYNIMHANRVSRTEFSSNVSFHCITSAFLL